MYINDTFFASIIYELCCPTYKFVQEAMKKSDSPLHMKYLQTMVECLFRLGKVAAAGAIIRYVAIVILWMVPILKCIASFFRLDNVEILCYL